MKKPPEPPQEAIASFYPKAPGTAASNVIDVLAGVHHGETWWKVYVKAHPPSEEKFFFGCLRADDHDAGARARVLYPAYVGRLILEKIEPRPGHEPEPPAARNWLRPTGTGNRPPR